MSRGMSRHLRQGQVVLIVDPELQCKVTADCVSVPISGNRGLSLSHCTTLLNPLALHRRLLYNISGLPRNHYDGLFELAMCHRLSRHYCNKVAVAKSPTEQGCRVPAPARKHARLSYSVRTSYPATACAASSRARLNSHRRAGPRQGRGNPAREHMAITARISLSTVRARAL